MVTMAEGRAGTPISLVVIHTNEGDNKPGDIGDDHTAEDLAGYLRRECAAGRGKSYHRVWDDDSSVRVVPDEQAAWAAKAANRRSLNGCFTGWARWTRADWLTHRSMLARGAAEVAQWCARYDIAARHLSPAQVKAGERGIIGHGDWSAARMGDGSTHTDPGAGFPWDEFLAMVEGGTKGDDEMIDVQLPPTYTGGRPDGRTPAAERQISVRGDVWLSWAFDGAWIQEAWWNPGGQHPVSPDKGLQVDRFTVLRWVPQSGARFLVIRYSAPNWGVVQTG